MNESDLAQLVQEMPRSESVSGDDSLPSKHWNIQTPPGVDCNDYLVNSNKVTEKFDSREHELQHASDMSGDSVSSCLRVDIADIDGGDSLNLTTTHLRLCKQQVLRPYWRLLMLIGWRGFGKETVNNTSCGWQVLNLIYPLFITLLLIYTYIYEIVACQWKLDVRKDTQIITTSTTKIPNITTTSTAWPFMTFGPSFIGHKNLSDINPAGNDACEHIITTYVIPNFLHFVAFMMGLYHFRIQENEQLYALMEKVFLQATPLNSRAASQQNMIHIMRVFLAGGILWVLMLLGMQALYEWAFDFPRLKFFVIIGPNIHWLLFSIEMLGILILNSVTVAVVANYITQCEMILFYVKGVSLRLQEKSTDLKAAMKDILTVRLNLSLLNGPIARMTGLVSVIFAELAIIGCKSELCVQQI
ncbi:hypothetical protein ACJMK2_018856 [Sinanodonta woodiana]|uniref:Odorant receptor n=1 Tax=Sinanodonta woodiana TaxID=1069815 RepID=A0ABD3UIM4_SINWO